MSKPKHRLQQFFQKTIPLSKVFESRRFFGVRIELIEKNKSLSNFAKICEKGPIMGPFRLLG